MSEKLRPITPAKDWSPDSWQQYPAGQQATYPDNEAVEQVLGQLAKLPPLVTSWEIMALKKRIAAAQAGKQFVLQGGDCAELFSDCESRSEEHTSELQSRGHLVCRLLLEKKNKQPTRE